MAGAAKRGWFQADKKRDDTNDTADMLLCIPRKSRPLPMKLRPRSEGDKKS